MKRFVVLILLILTNTAHAQLDPGTRWTNDNRCWYDGLSQYRITWHLHRLAYNQSTQNWFVTYGCPGVGQGEYDNHITRTYIANIAPPCAETSTVLMEIQGNSFVPFPCGPLEPSAVPWYIELGPTTVGDDRTNGIRVGVDGAIGPGGGVVAAINYTIEFDGPYDYSVYAEAVGEQAGGVRILVEQGQLINEVIANSCKVCDGLLPDDPDEPDDPDPPIPGPGTGNGGGPNGETGPEYPGGPDNPEGLVCCHFEHGSVELSYQQCWDLQGTSYSDAPCEQEVLGCCTWIDFSVGPIGVTVQSMTTENDCVFLEGTWSPEPCDEGDCAECCAAILALLEDFTGDIQGPLRNWLLEDWPDFAERVLNVLEEPQDPTDPEINETDDVPVDGQDGAEEHFTALEVPDAQESPHAWTFDVLGTQQTFFISMDPRNWPSIPMYTLLRAMIGLIRLALTIGLLIMFPSMVLRMWRQW